MQRLDCGNDEDVRMYGYKVVDKSIANINEKLTYKITLKNNCRYDIINIILYDNISSGLTFIRDTLKIDGLKKINANPQIGVVISRMHTKSTIVISFDVNINNIKPIPSCVGSFATVVASNYKDFNTNEVFTNIAVKVDVLESKADDRMVENYNQESTELSKFIERNNFSMSMRYIKFLNEDNKSIIPNIEITKKHSMDNIQINKIIYLEFLVENIGSIDVFNSKIKIDTGIFLKIINGSFNINKSSIILQDNYIDIGLLNAGEKCTFGYKLKLTKGLFEEYINNDICIEFEYITSNNEKKYGLSNVVEERLYIEKKIFSIVNLEKTLYLNNGNLEVEMIDNVDLEFNVTKKYVMKTYEGIANDGRILSGYSFKIQGYVNINCEYSTTSGKIFFKNWKEFMSTVMVIPKSYADISKLDVFSDIEHYDLEVITSNEIKLHTIILFSSLS